MCWCRAAARRWTSPPLPMPSPIGDRARHRGRGVARRRRPPSVLPRTSCSRCSAASSSRSCRRTPATWTLGEVVRVLEAIERLQAELEQNGAQQFASRLTGPDAMQLLIEVVHDMRSPLNAILLLAEQLRSGRSGPLVDIQVRQMDLVHSAAFGLTTLARRRDRARARRQSSRRRATDAVLALERAQGRGRSRAAARHREAHRAPCHRSGGRRARRASRRGRSRAAQPHDERGQVHGAGLGHDRVRAALAHEARVLRHRHGTRHSAGRAADAVRSVPPARESQRVRVLELRASDCRSANSSFRRWAAS